MMVTNRSLSAVSAYSKLIGPRNARQSSGTNLSVLATISEPSEGEQSSGDTVQSSINDDWRGESVWCDSADGHRALSASS